MLTAVLSSVLIFLALAVGLIVSQRVKPLANKDTLTFENISNETTDAPALISYVARDGVQLGVRHYPGAGDDVPLVVVIHGSGWHGGAYTPIAEALSRDQGFEILIPDMRGHGPQPVRRGDIDYIGQLEDDLADLITAYNTTDRPVYMVGHSSGGGLTIRFAGGAHGDMLDKVVLMAPFLKHDAPTARADAGGWSHVLLRRLIGLSMLNGVGIEWFNGLHVIQFNFPPEVLHSKQGQTATTSYSYRLNTSFAPRSDYLADVAQLPPFLLLAGTQDEAFHAKAYKPTMSPANPNGQYRLIDGLDHLGIIMDKQALDVIGDFLN